VDQGAAEQERFRYFHFATFSCDLVAPKVQLGHAFIGVGAGRGGDRGIGPPLSGLGIIPPPTFCWDIGKKYQNLLRIA